MVENFSELPPGQRVGAKIGGKAKLRQDPRQVPLV